MIVKGPITEDKVRWALDQTGMAASQAKVITPTGMMQLVANRVCRADDTPAELQCEVQADPHRDPYEPEWEVVPR